MFFVIFAGMNRRDDSSIDSLEREYSEMDSSPRLSKSTTNLSRDSGLTLSDNQLYNDDSSEADQCTISLGSPRKSSFGRSVSQTDAGSQKIDVGLLSHSFDGMLDSMEHPPPVPPPRKNRRRGTEMPMHELAMLASRGPGTGPNIRHSNSTGHMHPLHVRMPKCDSLGSLEEYAEGVHTEEFEQLQEALNNREQLLRKSESGGRLFVNDELVAMHLKGNGASKKDMLVFPQQQGLRRSWGEILDDDSPMIPDLSASYGGMSGSPMSSPRTGLSASFPSLVSDVVFSLSPPESPISEPFHGVPRRPHSPPPYAIAVAATASCQSVDSAISSADSLEDAAPPRPPRPMNLGLGNQLSTSPAPDTGMSPSISHPKGILRHPLDLQKDPLILRKVHKGMTSTGADFFPKYMRSVMRHSLQEGDMQRMTREPIVKQHSNDSGFHQPDSIAGNRQHIMTQMRQMRSVEKSASDSRVTECFQPQRVHSVHNDRQKFSHAQLAVERRRPDKPPSYQEAIQRKSLLQNGSLYQASEKELMEQRQNSDRARQLYQESMRKYMEEQPNKADLSLPEVDQTDHKAQTPNEEPVYETMSLAHETQVAQMAHPQEVKKSPTQECKHTPTSIVSANQSHDQAQSQDYRQSHDQSNNGQPPKSHIHNNRNLNGHGHERTSQKSVHNNNNSEKRVSESGQDCIQKPQKRDSESRESTPVRKNSHERSSSKDNRANNNQNTERPKSRSKSREKRHGHRSSDTRLENSRSHEDREFRRSNLIRSKSDSHEHLNKIGKFKELKPLDNNIIEQYKRAKLEWNLSQDGMSNEEPKRRIQSVKHRDWHRELAEQYNQIFYQPTTGQQKSPQYAYVKSTKQEANENERPKRRWTPPVHPSKDLVIKNEGENRVRKNTPPRTVVKSENDFRNGQQYENSRKTASSEKENRPAPSDFVQMRAEVSHGVKGDEPENTQEDFALAKSKELSWSVAHLRNLYDENKNETDGSNPHFYCPGKEGQRPPPPPYRHPPPVTCPADSSSRRLAKEKTNPDAEESYV